MNSIVKKILFTGILVLLGCHLLFADHQIGSEMYYEYIGEGAYENSKLYKFNFVVYMKCSHPDTTDLLMLVNNTADPWEEERIILVIDSIRNFEYNFVNCNNRPPGICYNKLFYSDTVSIREEMLPVDVSSKICCRDRILNNIVSADTFGTVVNVVINESAYQNDNDSPIFVETNFLSFCVNEDINYIYGERREKIFNLPYKSESFLHPSHTYTEEAIPLRLFSNKNLIHSCLCCCTLKPPPSSAPSA